MQKYTQTNSQRNYIGFEDISKLYHPLYRFQKQSAILDYLSAYDSVLPTNWMEINLSSIQANISSLKNNLDKSIGIIAVVKCDAFGHGILPVSQIAFKAGVDAVGVGEPAEAFILRKAGFRQRVIMLYPSPAWDIEPLVQAEVEFTISTCEIADNIAYLARKHGKIIPVHIQVETGMHRYGIFPTDVISLISKLRSSESIRLEGLCSHFATIGEDNEFAQKQLDTFRSVMANLTQHDIRIPSVHIASSGGILYCADSYNPALFKEVMPGCKVFVRPGDLLYGMYKDKAPPLFLHHALTDVVSHVSDIQMVQAGEYVGYSKSYKVEKDSYIATIPIGWSNGLYVKKLRVIVNGQNHQILGSVSSNAIAIESKEAHCIGDRVSIIGVQGNKSIYAEEIASQNDLRTSQIISLMGEKMQRLYYEEIDV